MEVLPDPAYPSIINRMVTRAQTRAAALLKPPENDSRSNETPRTPISQLERGPSYLNPPATINAAKDKEKIAFCEDPELTPIFQGGRHSKTWLLSSPEPVPVPGPEPAISRMDTAQLGTRACNLKRMLSQEVIKYISAAPCTLVSRMRPSNFLEQVEALLKTKMNFLQCPLCHSAGNFKVDERRNNSYLLVKCTAIKSDGSPCLRKFNCVGPLAMLFPEAHFAKYVSFSKVHMNAIRSVNNIPEDDEATAPRRPSTATVDDATMDVIVDEGPSDELEDAILTILKHSESVENELAKRTVTFDSEKKALEDEIRRLTSEKTAIAAERDNLHEDLSNARSEIARLRMNTSIITAPFSQAVAESSTPSSESLPRIVTNVDHRTATPTPQVIHYSSIQQGRRTAPVTPSNSPLTTRSPSTVFIDSPSTSRTTEHPSVEAVTVKREKKKKKANIPVSTLPSQSITPTASNSSNTGRTSQQANVEPTLVKSKRQKNTTVSAATVRKVLQSKPQVEHVQLCSLVVSGIQACRLGTLRKVLTSSHVGIDPSKLANIEIISQNLIEFHVPLEYKSTLCQKLFAARDDLKILGESLDPMILEGSAKDAAEEVIRRFKRRLETSRDLDHRQFLRKYMEQAERQLATGKFSHFNFANPSRSAESSNNRSVAVSTTTAAIQRRPARSTSQGRGAGNARH